MSSQEKIRDHFVDVIGKAFDPVLAERRPEHIRHAQAQLAMSVVSVLLDIRDYLAVIAVQTAPTTCNVHHVEPDPLAGSEGYEAR